MWQQSGVIHRQSEPTNGRPASARRGVLFTAFEPSGDDHASVVIAELKRRAPDVPVYAWGGPRMERAGATVIERTGEAAVVGVPGVGKILEHVRINRRVEDWLDKNPVALHVPVDAPDANFAICAMARRRGARVMHLVAPQLWAWREGRIRRLRALTNLVLCVLPFEEQWFLSRGVPARFVGHPLFETPLDEAALDAVAAGFGDGSPKIALMPGSRPGEIKRSFPPLLDAYRQIRRDFPRTRAVIACTKPEVEAFLRRTAQRLGGWPEGLLTAVDQTDAVIRWCDLAVVASGTVTLQVAKQAKPMVTFYRLSQLYRVLHTLIGRWLITTDLFTLPNLIAGKRIVTELVPHFGDGHELAVGVYRLLRQPGLAEQQRQELVAVTRKFQGRRAGILSADAILEMLGVSPAASAAPPSTPPSPPTAAAAAQPA